MKRKFLSTIICLAVLLLAALLLPTRAQAASESDLTFTLNGDGESYSVTDCNYSASGSLTIPATYNGKPVSGIGSDAFYYCSNLTSITIPDSVTSIGDSAFSYCSSLTSITIPDSVTSIGKYAFQNCSSLTSITIPDSVTSIGSSAFYGCSRLTSINIPDSVTSIGDWAFCYCSSLTGVYISDIAAWCSIDFYNAYSNPLRYAKKLYLNGELVTNLSIPDSVTSIGDYAFDDCSSLTSITLPDSVTSIGKYAFSGCSRLTGVYISDIAAWCNIDFDGSYSNPLYYAKNLYLNGKLVTNLSIPDSVTSIGSYAFYGCSSLTSITLPDSVTSIDSYAFSSCSSLTSITIPDSVTSIGSYAFSSCSSLTSITIPDSVTSIGDSAFYNCSSLTSITIPDSVTSIGNYAFYGCSSLSHVAYTGIQSQWSNISIGSNNTALTSATLHYETALIHTNNCVETSVYCPVCKIYLYQSENENGIHTYGDWVVTIPATFNTEGEKEKICSICGDTVIEPIDQLVGMVSQWNVTLNNDLRVNFYLNISECIESTARVRIYVGEEGYTYRVSTLEKNKDGLYLASVNIAAAQMSDYIFITVLNGNDIGATMSYTVRQYADTVLADESHSKNHHLVREMLNYGAAAQIYFDYEASNLANNGITGAGQVAVPESVDVNYTITGSADGVKFYGASLVFREKIAIRYYFNFVGAINDCSFIINGISYAPALNDGLYYIEMNDILPQNLDQSITLTVTDAAENELKIDYSPMNYIVRMNEKGSQELKNLLKALYNYHLAAKEFSQTAA